MSIQTNTTNALIENYSTVGYHGTSQASAKSIKTSNFEISKGDDHWLGQGVYFFESHISDGIEDAKKWAKVSAWDNDNRRYTYDHYIVLKAPLQFEKLWDLCDKEGLQLFEHCRAAFLKRGVKYPDPKSGRKFDNCVIDYSAKLVQFDGLRCWFFIKLDGQSRKMNVLPGIPNVTVLCVRDTAKCILLDHLTEIVDGYTNR
jgi:hypothetical protein